MNRSDPHRAGGAMVEAALILPVVLLVLVGLIVGGLGVFRYLQVSSVAREASRWASVHGTQHGTEVLGAPGRAATEADIQTFVRDKAVGLDPARLSCSVRWDQSNAPVTVTSSTGDYVINTVTVEVSYQWFPELFLTGPRTLTSRSTVPMSY